VREHVGKHSMDPSETRPDGVDLEDERMDLGTVFWETAEDYMDDRRLRPETVARLKRTAASLASGLVVAVALASWPVLKGAVLGGDVDLPTLFESVRVAAGAAASAYMVSRIKRHG
jgi:hypothetical protein